MHTLLSNKKIEFLPSIDRRKVLASRPYRFDTSQTTSPPSWSRIGAIRNRDTDSSPFECSTIENLRKKNTHVKKKCVFNEKYEKAEHFLIPRILVLRNRDTISPPRNVHWLVTISLTNQRGPFAFSDRKSNRFFGKLWWSCKNKKRAIE